ncbi:U-box domain-containing protein 14-like [Canna indica]|uniref:U-box domain-containing protein 14-like n=1 Tax=Canna indica TaxID=4628 RepID=A0AAQ3L3E8_9LILI|nr:U-box domain-containing protein 14-like [Canna indica]
MAKCARTDAAGFRLWPAFSPAAVGRWLLDAMACGASRHRERQMSRNAAGVKDSRARGPRPGGPGRLMELIQAEPSESDSEEAADSETQRKIEAFEELQRAVARLQLDGVNICGDEKGEAAAEIRRLAKDDPDARETLALLGAIPPLVGMLDSEDSDVQISALYALLNLGIGNELNKAAIVKAGAVHKMLNLIECGSSQSVSEAIVANFLGLSALDSNKSIIGASGAIPFLVSAFRSPNSSSTARQDALRALFNLSLASANLPFLVDAGLAAALLSAIGDMEISERALAVLCNLVATGEGRRAVSRSPDALVILVDVLAWCDAAACQEKAAYVLMVMAHKSPSDRAAMVGAGIVFALLELTLLGTPLAQKRASRLLEILTTEKGKGLSDAGSTSAVPSVSAPLSGAVADEAMSEEKKGVKELVQQSLQTNMKRIVRRANLPQDFEPSERLRALTGTSTSKSLPF